jgi:hypothetical protein
MKCEGEIIRPPMEKEKTTSIIYSVIKANDINLLRPEYLRGL